MFLRESYVLLWIFPSLYYLGLCKATGELTQTYLALYSPGDPEYTDVIVRKVGENLTLVCELKGDSIPRIYVWNYVPSDNATEGEKVYKTEPRGKSLSSRLTKLDLQLTDSGHYVCAAPPHSISKYILVQAKNNCSRGGFWCDHCVFSTYVCDGYSDCRAGEDEAPGLCMPHVCSRPDKLNCSSGRCISEAACCRVPSPLCKQHDCCNEHTQYRPQVWGEEYPPLFEDRHAPDEYGFIQSTIYTVTACALIFMIAVVLLVSAICKMHMKRAALRSYTQRPARLASLNQLNARQMHRFPPCYEASRLLEAERLGVGPPHSPSAPLAPAMPSSPAQSPHRDPNQWRAECGEEEADGSAGGFGLARLSSLFTSRYRQVATECLDVELRAVRAASNPASPARAPLPHYRSPTGTDLSSADYFLHTEVSDCGRDLNYMAAGNFIRRNQREPRPLTLQLGRFQLSIPRLGRRASDRRPDTPNIAEINIDDLDFVRLNSNETYTLNGRTIRLLGADFENYPMLNNSNVRPPPYTESMRYKLYGPPPEYLSRDTLNNEREVNTTVTEERARENIEEPPCYDELSSNNDSNGNNVITVIAVTETNENNTQNLDNNNTETVTSLSDVIDDLPAIDDVNANEEYIVETAENVTTTNNNVTVTNNNVTVTNNN